MTHRPGLILVSLVITLALSMEASLCAQVPDPLLATQAPVAGAGHHYIGIGAETVNPADGSLSFDLPIKTPDGRGLSFPFGIRYSSSEELYLTNLGSQYLGWYSHWPSTQLINGELGSLPPSQVGAWSYDLPLETSQSVKYFTAYDTVTGPCGEGPCTRYPYICDVSDNFVFRGLDGEQTGLPIGLLYGDPNNLTNDPLYKQDECSGNSNSTYAMKSPGNNHGILSSFQIGPSSLPVGLTVVDHYGTTYQFPFGGWGIPFQPQYLPMDDGALATSITDRNGNQIALAANGLGYIDTLGRTLVKWTGIDDQWEGVANSNNNNCNSNNTCEDQITISGLQNPATLKWTTITIGIPAGYTSTNSTGTQSDATIFGSTSFQVLSTAVSTTVPAVSEIDLPNGQKYTFDYSRNPYGKVDEITFPDGGWVKYTWGYNNESQSTLVSWATGGDAGTVSADVYYSIPAIATRTVSFDGQNPALTQTFTYGAPNWNGTSWTSKSTLVSTTDNVTGQTTAVTYTYGAEFGDTAVYVGGALPLVPVETSVVYSGSAGGAKTVYKTWGGPHLMMGEQTILDGDTAHATTTENCYDWNEQPIETVNFDFSANATQGAPYNPDGCYANSALLKIGPFVAGSQNYDLYTAGVGPALRKTVTAYQPYFNPASYSGTHIVNAPASVTVCSGSSNSASVLTPSCSAPYIAQASYQYDQGGIIPSGAQTGLVAAPGTRANITAAAKWLNTTGNYLTTTYTYFDTGQVQSITDPCGNSTCADIQGTGHTTYFSYKDSPANSQQTNAYLTQVTHPNTAVQHQESFTWGYADGLLRSHLGQNPNQTANYWFYTNGKNGTSYDPFMRLTEVDLPGGGQTNYYYNDVTTGTGSSMNTSQLLCTSTANSACPSSSVAKTSNVIFDGMGHTVTAQLSSDSYSSNSTDTSTSSYDGLGRVLTVTNPERPTQALTDGVTTNGYDAIGRKISQIDSDGISAQSWRYNSNSVTYTDESGNQWLRTSDALGRLASVAEPNGSTKSPTVITNYGYDSQNNLTAVSQLGASGSTPRVRSFTYDSLSRLLCASNAENSSGTCPSSASTGYTSGTTGYFYDANGNVMNKYVPMPNSTVAGQYLTLSYTYDNLNRVRAKYSNDAPMTPFSCFQYDTPISSGSDGYPVGNPTLSWTQQSACPSTSLSIVSANAITSKAILSHDAMGHVLIEQQCTPSNCTGTPYQLNYSYDLAGNVLTYTNGLVSTPGATTNPVTFTQTFDAADRLQSVYSNWLDATHPANLFMTQSAGAKCAQSGYAAPGLLENVLYGGALTVCRTHDSRLHATSETDTGTTLGASTTGTAAILITGGEQSN